MPYTDQQIRELANQLAAKGAPEADIDSFVRSALADQAGGLEPAKPYHAPQQVFGAALPPPGMGAAIVDKVTDLGIRSGAPAAGQALGVATGPFAEVAVPALGAIGGAVGEVVANAREGIPNTMGKIAGAMIAGAIPGASLAKAGTGAVAKEAVKYAGANTLAQYAESVIDRGEVPDAAQLAIGDVAAAAGAPAAKFLARGAPGVTEAERLFQDRDAAAKAVRSWGVVTPPPMMDKGSDLLASIAGPEALKNRASAKNLFAWQKKARADIGLSEEALPIRVKNSERTGDILPIRAQAAEPYKAIEKIADDAKSHLDAIRKKYPAGLDGPDAAALSADLSDPVAKRAAIQAGADVNALKQYRENAQAALDALKQGDSSAYDKWITNRDAASAMENQIEHAAVLAGDTDLVKRLVKARQLYAKTYAVENAINRTTGLISAADLAAQMNAGVPLTGNLKKIADYANAFDKAAVDASAIRNPNVGKITGLAAMGQASRGNLSGAVGGILTATIGKPAQKILLSDLIQDGMLNPQEQQNFASSFARYLAENAQSQRRQEEPAAKE